MLSRVLGFGNRQLLRNKTNIALILIAAITTLSSRDNIAQNVQQLSDLRQKMRVNSAQQMNLLASEDNRAELEKVASPDIKAAASSWW